MKKIAPLLSALIFASAALAMASPSTAYHLDIAAPVQLAGSDSASETFVKDVLPNLVSIVDKNMTESQAAESLSAVSVDPNKLTLANDVSLRVYFVGEYASYANTLGVSTTGPGALSPDAALIFPNASSSAAWGSTERAGWAPLQPGDFVDLGVFKAGTKLDFFLIANGAYGGTDVFSTSSSANGDGLVHAMALSPAGSSYLLFGFEDIFGENVKVFGDLAFAVQMEIVKPGGLGAPEPSLALGGAFACLAFLGSYRRRIKG